MDIRRVLGNVRIWIGCMISGRWYDNEEVDRQVESLRRLRKEAAWHPLGCEIDGCDRIAKVVLTSASRTDYQVCWPCASALRRGFDDESGPTSAGTIAKPRELSELSDKTVPPPSEREDWELAFERE